MVHQRVPGAARSRCGGGRYRAGRTGFGAARALLESVVCHLGAIPNDGLDYGLLRYVAEVPELRETAEPQIQFSYLGRLDLGVTDQPWSPLAGPYLDALPDDPEPELPLRFALNLSAFVASTPTEHN